MNAPETPGHAEPPLSTLLDWLIENTTDDRGVPFSAESLAYHVQSQGIRLSASYVTSLRTGRRGSPRADLIAAIAQAFGVPIEYFSNGDVAAAVQADGRMAASDRREWTALMLRVAQLPLDQKRSILRNVLRQDQAE